jgi:hypothetical protein
VYNRRGLRTVQFDVFFVTSRGERRRQCPGCYSMRRPEMARAITSCWICSVPSKMS